MSLLLQILFIAIAAGLGANGVISNYVYGSTIGAGLMSHVYGAAGGAVDAFKMILPPALYLIANADPVRQPAWASARPYVAPLWALFAFLTAWSIFCAYSLHAQTAERRAAVTAAASVDSARLASDQTSLERDLANLRAETSREALEGQLAAMRQDALWSPRRSDRCTNATVQRSITFCAEYRRLEGLASAARPASAIAADKAQARAQLGSTRSQRAALNEAAGKERPDVALSGLAGALDVDLDSATLVRSGIFSALLELVGSAAALLAAVLWRASKATELEAKTESIAPADAETVTDRPALPPTLVERAKATAYRRPATGRPARRTVTPEMVTQAVALINEQGFSKRKAASQLQIPEATLRNALERQGVAIG
ncbi:MAG: hypothetical protein AAGM38_13250 [Pseudomonadota bacterium]